MINPLDFLNFRTLTEQAGYPEGLDVPWHLKIDTFALLQNFGRLTRKTSFRGHLRNIDQKVQKMIKIRVKIRQFSQNFFRLKIYPRESF